MSALSSPNDPDVLDGWKNIADYLGKSVRTAQRWRQEFGMPVHRLGGREGENVYAFRSELDAWRRSASRLSGFAAASADAEERSPAEAQTEHSARNQPFRRAWLAWGAGSSLLLLAALGFVAWTGTDWLRAPRSSPSPAATEPDAGPARWVAVGDHFQVYNAAGEELWLYRPGPALATSMYVGHTDPARLPLPDVPTEASVARPLPSVFISDLDGDGRREVLVIAHARDPVERSSLHCLGEDGSLRWVFKPSDALGFGGEDNGLPVRLPWVTVSKDDHGTASIWVSAEHSTWFPTTVYRLSSSGEVLGRYGSNGRVKKIRFLSSGGRQFALLGGVNNERKTAALAVFDVARFGGAAPAETPTYRCDNCTPGQPDHYLVFPRSDLSQAIGGMPFVAEFAVQPSGEVVASVQHVRAQLPGEELDALALINYRIDSQWRVFGAEFFDQFVTIHDHYASLGRLDHRFQAAREQAQLWPVLRWNGSGYDRVEGPER